MHSTMAASKAGQLKGCTIIGASNSMATEKPILTNSHDMKLTALLTADMPEGRPVVPRANNAPGTTTTAAPYSSDHAHIEFRVTSPASKAITPPKAAWAATTHHGESTGWLARQAAASCLVSDL